MDVVILAGGRCPIDLESVSGVSQRAMLPIQGRPIVEKVIESTRFLGEAILVGGPKGLSSRQLNSGGHFIESLKISLQAIQTEKFLLCTCDLPFITQEIIEDYLQRCDSEALFHYPIVKIEKTDSPLGKLKRTTLKLQEGRFTGGNIALVDKQMMIQTLPIIEHAYHARKKPLKLAQMIGVGTLFRVLIGQTMPYFLNIQSLENAVTRFLGAPVKAVISPYLELGADVDTAQHYLAAQSILKSK